MLRNSLVLMRVKQQVKPLLVLSSGWGAVQKFGYMDEWANAATHL
jgi:hypothetical protein